MTRRGFLERTTEHLLDVTEHSLYAERTARGGGLLQKQDARVKVAGFLLLIVAAALSRHLAVIAILFALAIVLAVASRIPLSALASRAWAGVLIFTGLIALPAIFLTPGRVVAEMPLGLTITAPGLRTAALLVARAETAVTLALVLVLTTLWPQLLYALRALRVPAVLVAVLAMTYRYIFVLLRTADDMMEARRSRSIARTSPAIARQLAATSAGVLLGTAMHLSNEVHLAMISRGYRGEVRLLDPPRMRAADWLALAFFVAVAAAAIWSGR